MSENGKPAADEGIVLVTMSLPMHPGMRWLPDGGIYYLINGFYAHDVGVIRDFHGLEKRAAVFASLVELDDDDPLLQDVRAIYDDDEDATYTDVHAYHVWLDEQLATARRKTD